MCSLSSDRKVLKIAFLLDEFPVVSETFIVNQITGLLDRGHHIDIYATRPSRNQNECVNAYVTAYRLIERVRYTKLFGKSTSTRLLKTPLVAAKLGFTRPGLIARSLSGRRYGPYWKSLRYLFAACEFRSNADAYDVVHCHFGNMGLVGQFLSDNGLLKGAVLTTFHGADTTQLPRVWSRDVYRPLFARGEHFTANSEFTKSRLIELGCAADRISIIRMGIRLDEFPLEVRHLAAGETPVLVSVARLVSKKGIEYAIRAVAALRDRGVKVDYRVVGDGPLKDKLQSLIEALGVADRVHLLGWKDRDGVAQTLRESHLLLAPSVTSSTGDMEGQGVVLQEAQAMGLPVIATRHNGFPEGIDEGKSGWLVPEHDCHAIASTVESLLARRSEWAEFGAAGRRFVESRFDLEKLNDELVELYGRLSGC